MRYGMGTLKYYDGMIYNGKWKKDMYHGMGEFTWPNGNFYKGTLV